MKKDVAEFCNICHISQTAKKSNVKISMAPVHPILVCEEPFNRVIIDSVSPLIRTKRRNKFILTILCTASKFPEAILLKTISPRKNIGGLTNFFTKFGLSKEVQSDQGSNFIFRLFRQATRQLDFLSVA